MLTPFDDYPLHQAAKPLAAPGTTDRNAYDRYWFGAYHRRADIVVEAAFGRYPNLGVVDGSVSIVVDGVQHAFHASGAAPVDPTATEVGPMRLEVVRPMRELRVVVADNETGVAAELRWRSRVGALLEDHTVMGDGRRTIVDMDRFVQFGNWSGAVVIDGTRVELNDDEVVGVRDRSWGVRPVGPPVPGRPPDRAPSNCWLWAPVHFDDECRTVGYFERPGGEIWRGDGFRIPVVDPVADVTQRGDPGVTELTPVGQRITFQPGTRWIADARFDLVDHAGAPDTLHLRPGARFQMRGLGYTNPDWTHGAWKGDAVVGRETWRLDDLDPLDPHNQHVHHAVVAEVEGREGVGLLEQIIFGPHTQFGFHEQLDGAAGAGDAPEDGSDRRSARATAHR